MDEKTSLALSRAMRRPQRDLLRAGVYAARGR